MASIKIKLVKNNNFNDKMLILTNGADVSFEEYHEIFDAVFSPSIGKNVSLAEK